MAAIARGFDDVLVDNIVTLLSAYSAAQVIEGGPSFKVERGRIRPLKPTVDSDHRVVSVSIDGNAPESKGAAGRALFSETVTINVDCFVIEKYSAGATDPADLRADKNLAYLKEQVRHGLYALATHDFSMPVGVIASKSMPTWAPMIDEENEVEQPVIAGRWSFSISYSWKPADIPSHVLAAITVRSQLVGADYSFGG